MEILRLSELAAVTAAEADVYDGVTGVRLIARGDPITAGVLQILSEYKLTVLAVLSRGEVPESLLRKSRFREIPLADIAPGMPLAFDVHAPDGSLLLGKGAELSQALIEKLLRRRVSVLLVRQDTDPAHLARLSRARELLRGEMARSRPPRVVFDRRDLIENPRLLTRRVVAGQAERLERSGGLRVRPEENAQALLAFAQKVDALRERKEKTREHYRQLYRTLVDQTWRIFATLKAGRDVDGQMVLSMTGQVVAALVTDRELLLGAIVEPPPGEDYLSIHAVNVAVLAVNIAAAAGLSVKQATELAYGALLADAGMLHVSDGIRFKSAALSSEERTEVMRHTLYGIDRLQQVSGMPATTPLVAYQSHERLDGSGYPHGRRARGIHDYAKIVALADVYQAQVGQRPFRAAGRMPYKALEEILRMVSRRKLDGEYAKALLAAVGLFPVGSWVRLNTGECARVVAANPELFTRPVVNVLFDARGERIPSRRIDLAREPSVNVTRAETVEVEEALLGF